MGFQQGLSGLNASSKDLDVIGNNIANANTYGAKSSRAEFADVYASAISGAGTDQVGIGVTVQTVAQQFTQGNITTTDNNMDLAINGDGFFQVAAADTTSSGNNTTYYTRNGQFKVDDDGYIVNNSSQRLLGYPADGTGTIQTGTTSALKVPTAGISPKATTSVDLEINLNSANKVTATTTSPAIDFSDATTYNSSTPVTAYDAKGQAVTLNYYFQKSAENTWNVYVTANGTPTKGTTAAPEAQFTLSFSSDGSTVTSPTGGETTFDIPATTATDGSTTMTITGVKLSLDKATQYGSAFSVTNSDQDGYAAGQLSGLTFEKDGTISARYSNGQTKAAGQVELATFHNPQGLQSVGNNDWVSTYASGSPIVGVPSSGNLGVLQSGALEESNVDLTGELVNMITAQRAYQANAQTIKTQDQVLQTLVNLR